MLLIPSVRWNLKIVIRMRNVRVISDLDKRGALGGFFFFLNKNLIDVYVRKHGKKEGRQEI